VTARATAALLALLAGCVHVADDRARRDERVGRAEAGGASVEVEDGLAAVRAFAPGELELWAQAPALRIHLRPGPAGATVWRVTTRNVLADAALEATVAGGVPAIVELDEAPLPTRRTWRVILPAAADAVLTLAPPDVDDPSPWRFGAFADVQEALPRVGDIYARMAEDPDLRFVVMSGDLTRRGTDAQLARFQRELEGLPVPCYATLGNHELGTRDDAFHDHFGRGSFRFVYRGVQFTFLDSASATLSPMVYGWLADWLEEGQGRFHVVLMHIPPLDPIGLRNGGFASRGEGHRLVAELARGGVDVAIYGHIHSFYAHRDAGIPTYITGGGGAIPERFDGLRRHYLAVDLDPPRRAHQAAVVRVD
jgi:3',5'-cyclic-AMP phosphodiesterase